MTPMYYVAEVSYLAGLALPFAVLWTGLAVTAWLWPRDN